MKNRVKYIYLGVFLTVFSSILPMHMGKQLTVKQPIFSNNQAKNIGSKRFFHIDHLKNLYNGFAPDKKHISPLNGVALAESGWLKNLYIFGNKNHATVRLHQSLFHLQGEQFRPTRNKSLPGASITPSLLGDIIGALETGNLQQEPTIERIAKQWVETHKQTYDCKPSLIKIKNILNLIAQSNQESHEKNPQSYYLPGITHAILGGFLYKKSEKKEDRKHYSDAINAHEPIFSDEHTHYNNDVYTDDTVAEHIDTLNDIVNAEDRVNHQELFITAEEHYEKNIYALLKRRERMMPPQVIQSSYSYQKKPAVANCMEASVQGLFNWLLYRPESTQFDFSILPAHIQPHQTLKDFYTAFPSFNVVNERITGQTWMDKVSGIDGVEYHHGTYEINPSVKNIINLINYFFNIQATTLKQVGSQLSDSNRSIEFIANNDSDNDTTIDIHLSYSAPVALKKILHVKITPEHADFKVADTSKKDDMYDASLGLRLLKRVLAYDPNAARGQSDKSRYLLGLIPNPQKNVYLQEDLPYKLGMHILCSSDVDDPEIAVKTIVHMIEHGSSIDHALITLLQRNSGIESTNKKLGKELVAHDCFEQLHEKTNVKSIVLANSAVTLGAAEYIIKFPEGHTQLLRNPEIQRWIAYALEHEVNVKPLVDLFALSSNNDIKRLGTTQFIMGDQDKVHNRLIAIDSYFNSLTSHISYIAYQEFFMMIGQELYTKGMHHNDSFKDYIVHNADTARGAFDACINDMINNPGIHKEKIALELFHASLTNKKSTEKLLEIIINKHAYGINQTIDEFFIKHADQVKMTRAIFDITKKVRSDPSIKHRAISFFTTIASSNAQRGTNLIVGNYIMSNGLNELDPFFRDIVIANGHRARGGLYALLDTVRKTKQPYHDAALIISLYNAAITTPYKQEIEELYSAIIGITS